MEERTCPVGGARMHTLDGYSRVDLKALSGASLGLEVCR